MVNNSALGAKPHPVTSNIFSRFQSYWSGSASYKPAPPTQYTGAPQPRFLKVKIVTWNMHDSSPKGDLEELLGKVPSYSNLTPTMDGFPALPNDGNHPYHVVVVAGQECPTLSGIPMGFGAGFRRHDREKEKDRGREGGKGKEGTKEKSKEPDSNASRSKQPKDKEEGKRKKADEDMSHEHPPPYGWTSMVEDWLCNGGGHGLRNGVPTIADIGVPKPLIRRTPSKEPRRGPYQLLVKERLMGIYMAIYVHRDIQGLVKGCSKSAVAAGLIGGRVGNKGGVGISIDLEGTTFLFLNAHLAAHGSKVNHRLANLSKIKAELSVDSYLRPDDPRMMTEDLTDKFDFTFLCGDLNFRLDITRLHADWLISRQEYAQALHFDQLKRLMDEGKAFVGFNEAPINFPPTFKYDVLRTLKKTRRGVTRRGPAGSPVFTSQEQLAQDKGEEDVDGDDAVSVPSLSSSSTNPKSADEQGERVDYFVPAPTISTPDMTPSTEPIHKARKRWLGLLSPSSPYKSSRSSPREKSALTVPTVRKSLEGDPRLEEPDLPFVQRHSFESNGNHNLQLPAILLSSTKSSLQSDEPTDDQDKTAYDSSHKQRVPSWCDRILWKSTLQPDLAEGDGEPSSSMPSRSKSPLVQRFVNAMRPLSARARSSSQDSMFSIASDSGRETVHSASVSVVQSALLSRTTQLPGSPLIRSQSHESLQPQPPNVSGSKGRIFKGRSSSATTIPTSAPATLQKPVRSATDHSQLKSSTRDSFWRLFPSFLTSPQSSSSSPTTPATSSVPQNLLKHHKGDVVCLSYQTLDDRAMRRLKGRSDHRPVIGSYAVYF